MDEETRKQLEYEEQFYGISSQFFVDSCKYLKLGIRKELVGDIMFSVRKKENVT